MCKIEKKISKIIGKTIFNYKMIQENDKILVAYSGGKDSITLLYHLFEKSKTYPIKFSVEALHIHTEFCLCSTNRNNYFKDIKIHIKEININKRLKNNKTMNCYWCSTQRRIELLDFAKKNNFTKIAFGHHLDDIIETLLMNIFYRGEFSGMLPKLDLDNHPISFIRPLALLKESQITEFIKQKGFDSIVCSCPFSDFTKRKIIKEKIKKFIENDDSIKFNIFKSMGNIKLEYLLGRMSTFF